MSGWSGSPGSESEGGAAEFRGIRASFVGRVTAVLPNLTNLTGPPSGRSTVGLRTKPPMSGWSGSPGSESEGGAAEFRGIRASFVGRVTAVSSWASWSGSEEGGGGVRTFTGIYLDPIEFPWFAGGVQVEQKQQSALLARL